MRDWETILPEWSFIKTRWSDTDILCEIFNIFHFECRYIRVQRVRVSYYVPGDTRDIITQSNSVRGGLSVQPEPDPGENNNESTGQIDLPVIMMMILRCCGDVGDSTWMRKYPVCLWRRKTTWRTEKAPTDSDLVKFSSRAKVCWRSNWDIWRSPSSPTGSEPDSHLYITSSAV